QEWAEVRRFWRTPLVNVSSSSHPYAGWRTNASECIVSSFFNSAGRHGSRSSRWAGQLLLFRCAGETSFLSFPSARARET
ncbi:hypothetical protein L9F63_012156, partial [Diploptera punctata]